MEAPADQHWSEIEVRKRKGTATSKRSQTSGSEVAGQGGGNLRPAGRAKGSRKLPFLGSESAG